MWSKIYADLAAQIDRLSDGGENRLFFRGHRDARWLLLPGLARCVDMDRDVAERRLYFDFVVRGGTLLPDDRSGWAAIFAMQHHGVPTRLLDWTETFSVALYFAIKDAKSDAAIWALRPGILNAKTMGVAAIYDAPSLGGTYEEIFFDHTKELGGDVVALSPFRHNPRLAQQRAGFTLHRNLEAPLENLYPHAVTKIAIPLSCHDEARRFLRIAGVSEFTLFPDLDGLARELNEMHVASTRAF